MMESTNCIYAYKTKDTNKTLYIGKTINLKRRHKQHVCVKKVVFVPFDTYAKEYGWNNIILEVLEQNLSKEQMRIQERFWYLQLRPLCNRQMPYNTDEDRENYWNRKLYAILEQECLFAMRV